MKKSLKHQAKIANELTHDLYIVMQSWIKKHRKNPEVLNCSISALMTLAREMDDTKPGYRRLLADTLLYAEEMEQHETRLHS